MPTFSPIPTYYQVTWNYTSPNGYTNTIVAGSTQDGGLDSKKAFDYYRTITVTGIILISGTPMSAGQTFIINGYTITFAAADTLNDIIRKINIWSRLTNVIADQRVQSGYISLSNSNNPGCAGQPFYIAEGNGALGILGLTANQYQSYPSLVGQSFSNVTVGSNIVINGYNVQFPAGGNVGVVASAINAATPYTGVIAQQAANRLQLSTQQSGGPWNLNNVNASIGFVAGLYIGQPNTLVQSQSKELGNMRWEQVIAQLSMNTSPNYVDNLVVTGNYLGNAVPTTFSFTVGYEHPDQVRTVALPTEPDAGTVFIGEYAVQREVARALTNTWAGSRKVYDPTLNQVNVFAVYNNTPGIMNLTVSGIDIVANINVISQNITVTPYPGL